jgi:hypothetical protein
VIATTKVLDSRKVFDRERYKMEYQARFKYEGVKLERRMEALKELRVVDGKNISYGKYLHDYIRSMSFTYHASGDNAKKYKKISMMVEQMAKAQWANFKIAPLPLELKE